VVTHLGLPQIRTKEESLEHADDLPEPEELGTEDCFEAAWKAAGSTG
jgi:hypothetical protein